MKYYTYADLRRLLQCNQDTVIRNLSKLNVRAVRFGGSNPRFNALDVLSSIEFGGKLFKELNLTQKREIKDILNNE
jgi:hypothetical protein